MSMRITEECTACGLCMEECPTESITEGDIYVINPNTCNECKDEDEQQCVSVCPIVDDDEICIAIVKREE